MGMMSKWEPSTVGSQVEDHEARPVGVASKGLTEAVTATRIELSAGSSRTLIYSDEFSLIRTKTGRTIDYQKEQFHEVNKRYSYRTHRYGWQREEYTVDKSNEHIAVGFHLIRAEWPYANCVAWYAPFKCSKRGSPTIFLLQHSNQPWKRMDIDKEYISSLGMLQERVEALPYDYWTDEGLLVAASFVPAISVEVTNQVRDWTNTHEILGVCENFEAYRQELTTSAEVKKMLQDTENNRIRFEHPKAGLRVKLWPESIAQGENIMAISIAQALSGLDKEHEYLRGQPVIKLVHKLYRNGLDNYNRRMSTQRRGEKNAAEEQRHFLKDAHRNSPFRH